MLQCCRPESRPTTISREQVLAWLQTAEEEDVQWFSSYLSRGQAAIPSHSESKKPMMKSTNNHEAALPQRSESQKSLQKSATSDNSPVLTSRSQSHFSLRSHETNFEIDIADIDRVEALHSEQVNYSIRQKVPGALAREREDYNRASVEEPIVCFSAPMYFCSLDEENHLALDVIRIGNCDSKSEVNFTTVNGTAKAGEKFVQKSGRVTFSEGFNSEELRIDLMKSEIFDTTTEFTVELLTDSSKLNCNLHRYLYMARVKVIDGNCFPANKFRKQIEAREISAIPFPSLVWEYLKFNVQSPVTKRGTIKFLLVGVCHSLYNLLQLLARLFLVDKVLGEAADTARIQLIVVALVVLCPMLLLHYLDYRKTMWKVGGSSRGRLQNFLMRKFLNYDFNIRLTLSSADLIVAATELSGDVVDNGYMKVLKLAGALTDFMSLIIFQFLVPFIPVFNADVSEIGFIFLIIFPVVLSFFVRARGATTTKYISNKNEAEVELVGQMERTVMNYNIISEFNRRPFFEKLFQDRIAAFNNAAVQAAQVLTNNKYFAPWVTSICVAFYTIYGGHSVLDMDDSLSLGVFLSNLSVLTSIGKASSTIYQGIMDLEATSPAWYRIVELINLRTDLPERKALNRAKRKKTAILREKVRQTVEGGWAADNLPIELDNLNFAFGGGRHKSGFSMTGRLHFHQGELIALVGPAGGGKATLLQMLGEVVMPAPGQLFVPSHLRILHMSSRRLFFRASLYDNLVFGCRGQEDSVDNDGRIERVVSICGMLGLNNDIMELIKTGREGPVEIWSEVISHSNQDLLQFARAMITNPDFLCMHQPFSGHGHVVCETLMAMLRTFVEEKGVEQDSSTRHLRRPRTVATSGTKLSQVVDADHIYYVTQEYGIRHVPKELAQDHNLEEIAKREEPNDANLGDIEELVAQRPRQLTGSTVGDVQRPEFPPRSDTTEAI